MFDEVFIFGDRVIELDESEMKQIALRYKQLLLKEFIEDNYELGDYNVETIVEEVLEFMHKMDSDDCDESVAIRTVMNKHNLTQKG